MSPKPRLPENKGLPARWQLKHGAYYYRVPPGQEAQWDGKTTFRLGGTLPEAYRAFSARIDAGPRVYNVGTLLDRYALEVIPTKAAKTQAHNTAALARLRAEFGTASLRGVLPRHVYAYVDRRGAKIAAHREIEVLSHAFTKAVEWGYIDRHPFKGEVRLTGEKPRTRYVEDWEIVECLGLPSRRKRGSVDAVQAYIRVKLLTGLRRGDLLRLRVADCGHDGIHVGTHKTGRPVVYEWSLELRKAYQDALASRPIDISPYVFCTRKGASYLNEATGNANGWDSMWQRFMARVLAETKVIARFTEHDLRAKCASDAETLEHARQLLAHADGKLTERIYRRKPARVRPLR